MANIFIWLWFAPSDQLLVGQANSREDLEASIAGFWRHNMGKLDTGTKDNITDTTSLLKWLFASKLAVEFRYPSSLIDGYY